MRLIPTYTHHHTAGSERLLTLFLFFFLKTFTSDYGCSSVIMGTESRRAGSSASLSSMPGSGTRLPFGGLPEKQTLAEGFTQRGDCWRRRADHKKVPVVACGHMCACESMHVCTYIIHVHEGIGQKNKEHNTYIRKGVRGLKRPCLSLGAQVLSAEAPLGGRQPGWVGEWVGGTQREKPLTENTAARGKQRLTDSTCASWKAVPLLLLIIKTGINNKDSSNQIEFSSNSPAVISICWFSVSGRNTGWCAPR